MWRCDHYPSSLAAEMFRPQTFNKKWIVDQIKLKIIRLRSKFEFVFSFFVNQQAHPYERIYCPLVGRQHALEILRYLMKIYDLDAKFYDFDVNFDSFEQIFPILNPRFLFNHIQNVL